jgi:hypothetical protein
VDEKIVERNVKFFKKLDEGIKHFHLVESGLIRDGYDLDDDTMGYGENEVKTGDFFNNAVGCKDMYRLFLEESTPVNINKLLSVDLFVEDGKQKVCISGENGSGCTYEVKDIFEIADSIRYYIENYCL